MTLPTHRDGFFDFIPTNSYAEVVLACDYAIQKRIICLISGDNGVGKSSSITAYIRMSERMPANGRYPYLYLNLSQSEKTDRAIFNKIVQTIRQDDKRYGSASDAKAAAFELWHRYGFKALFVDDVVELYQSGFEAIRTFHDRGPMYPRIPVILATTPSITETLQTSQYRAFFSRIGELYHFNKLERDEIGYLLTNIPDDSVLTFKSEQADADAIIDALYIAAGGATVARASIRDLSHALNKCDTLLRRKQSAEKAENQRIKSQFNVALIQEAIRGVGKIARE